MVGVPVVLQHNPLAVTAAPPSNTTVAMPTADVSVMVESGMITLLTDGFANVIPSRMQRNGKAYALDI